MVARRRSTKKVKPPRFVDPPTHYLGILGEDHKGVLAATEGMLRLGTWLAPTNRDLWVGVVVSTPTHDPAMLARLAKDCRVSIVRYDTAKEATAAVRTALDL